MFYDNLKKECEKRNIKITRLVLECGGTKGSLTGWKNGADPRSDIVIKIAKRLNVTTDELLLGNIENKTEEERLITAYRQLTDEGKRAVLSFAEMAAENPQYKKYTDLPEEA